MRSPVVTFSDGHYGNINMLGIFSQNLDYPFRLTIQLMQRYSDSLLNHFYDPESEEKSILHGTVDLISRFILSDRVK